MYFIKKGKLKHPIIFYDYYCSIQILNYLQSHDINNEIIIYNKFLYSFNY